MGLKILPVGVILEGKAYKDYVEITSEEVLMKINEGILPTTSQPSIGEVVDLYDRYKDGEILMMSIGDGLSGTYHSACSAKEMAENKKNEIINTQTLAGAYHYLVKKAILLKNAGYSIQEVIQGLQESIQNTLSFVISSDFQFLKRCGRLTPIAANVAGLLKVVPVLTLSEDRKKIDVFSINRTVKKSLDSIIHSLIEKGVNENYVIHICHAGVLVKANEVVNDLKSKIQNATYEIMELSPSLMLHGGPGCILVQAIKK